MESIGFFPTYDCDVYLYDREKTEVLDNIDEIQLKEAKKEVDIYSEIKEEEKTNRFKFNSYKSKQKENIKIEECDIEYNIE